VFPTYKDVGKLVVTYLVLSKYFKFYFIINSIMVKKITQYIIRFIQRILVAVLLTLIYVIGFGITALMIRIFRPSVLRHNRKEAVSYWQDARENDGLESSQRQS